VKPEDFHSQETGEVRWCGDHHAFVPAPLPPKNLLPSWELAAKASKASEALGRLSGAAGRLPNPLLLIRVFTRREALDSSRIEGTRTRPEQLVLFEAANKGATSVASGPEADTVEVLNYIRALNWGIEQVREGIPLCNRLIRGMHKHLLSGEVRGQYRAPGDFRSSAVHIGRAGSTPDTARYVPPPAGDIEGAMRELENFLNQEGPLPGLIEVALAHYQFEAIHPFLDGNGRVGRLLIILHLMDKGLLKDPLLYLSSSFERHRDEYIDRLYRVSTQGDWAGWLDFFLTCVIEASEDAIWRAERLLEQRASWRENFQQARSSALLLQIIDELFGLPALSKKHAAELLGVTFASASKHIDSLEKAGVLREVTGQKRNRIYMCDRILELMHTDRPAH
jgi:Fic family protein